MEKKLAFIVIIIALLYGYNNAKKKELKPIDIRSSYNNPIQKYSTLHYKNELKKLHTQAYLKQYIIDVINHGSSQLAFKSNEVMEGGIALEEDASKIACYVLELSGKKCKTPYPKDATMYYSSNCAGCHGDDGKGLHGAYPDLTLPTLLGIKKREVFLNGILK